MYDEIFVANVLNGVEPSRAAEAAGMAPEDAETAFFDVMRHVEDYVISSDMGFVNCRTLADARNNRLEIMEYLRRIKHWDNFEKPIVTAVLTKNKAEYARLLAAGFASKEQIADLTRRFISRVAHYLQVEDLQAYWNDPQGFVFGNVNKCMALVDRHPSFNEPHVYKNVTPLPFHADNAQQVLGN